jgi:tetratricopeptide (TPR) repeat protein
LRILRAKKTTIRKLLVSYCVLGLTLNGCSQKQVTPGIPVQEVKGKNLYKKANPSTLGEYIRSVYKVSVESGEESQTSVEANDVRISEIEKLNTHTQKNPNDFEARKQLANRFYEESMWGECLSELGEMRQEKPDDPEIALALARVWYRLGNFAKTLEYSRTASSLAPDSAEAALLMGRMLVEEGELQTAIPVLRRAVELAPDNAYAHAALGNGLIPLQKWGQARDILGKALRIDDSLTSAKKDLAYVLAQLGKQQEAFDQYLAVMPEADANNQLGMIMLKQERWAEAKELFREALAIQPSHPQAKLNLYEADSYLPIPSVITIPSLEVFTRQTTEMQVQDTWDKVLAGVVTALPVDAGQSEDTLLSAFLSPLVKANDEQEETPSNSPEISWDVAQSTTEEEAAVVAQADSVEHSFALAAPEETVPTGEDSSPILLQGLTLRSSPTIGDLPQDSKLGDSEEGIPVIDLAFEEESPVENEALAPVPPDETVASVGPASAVQLSRPEKPGVGEIHEGPAEAPSKQAVVRHPGQVAKTLTDLPMVHPSLTLDEPFVIGLPRSMRSELLAGTTEDSALVTTDPAVEVRKENTTAVVVLAEPPKRSARLFAPDVVTALPVSRSVGYSPLLQLPPVGPEDKPSPVRVGSAGFNFSQGSGLRALVKPEAMVPLFLLLAAFLVGAWVYRRRTGDLLGSHPH